MRTVDALALVPEDKIVHRRYGISTVIKVLPSYGESLSLFGVVLFPDTVDGQELLAHDCGLIGISMLEELVGMMKKVDKNEM